MISTCARLAWAPDSASGSRRHPIPDGLPPKDDDTKVFIMLRLIRESREDCIQQKETRY